MRVIYVQIVTAVTLLLLFAGCRSSQQLSETSEGRYFSADTTVINYRLVYVIHGDANYLYHDSQGQARQADLQQMKEAISVARKARHGEVFIYHQKPEKKVLWLFPRKDRVLLHYRNGILMHREKYSSESQKQSFVTESERYHKYKGDKPVRTFFLYFGHEIPGEANSEYHHSRQDALFNVDIFATGVKRFLTGGSKFELMILSTCDNGTPVMVSELQTLTRYLLASPQNLHLSHIDTPKILQLEQNPELSSTKLARSIAKDTYDRLSGTMQTAVTLSIYDLKKVGNHVNKLAETYAAYQNGNSVPTAERKNTDCAELPFWDEKMVGKGVSVFYKPPNFGKRTDQTSHSGWGCQR